MIKKSRRTITIFLVLGIICSSIIIITDSASATDWVIDGNTVYVDDANVYASATPHTLGSDGWVTFNFISKTYTGDIDIIWGFDTPTVTPRTPQLWKNYTHDLTDYHWVEHWGSKTFNNITSFQNLGIENYASYSVDYGNSNNTKLFTFTYSYDNVSVTEIAAFSSFDTNGSNYVISGNYDNKESYVYQKTFYDWKPFIADWDIVNYDYGGMNTWYLLKDVSIINNHNYMLRAWVDLPFAGNDEIAGKYWWAFKPSSETLNQAISNNHLYYLDPWWSSSWTYMKQLTIDHTFIDADLVYFPVLVASDNTTMLAKMDDGNSIRFTDVTNTTEYAFEIEYFDDSDEMAVWVNIPRIDNDVDTVFNMYYGNGVAADGQDVAATWNDDFLGVYHMNDSTTSTVIDSKGINAGDKLAANNPAQATGKIAYGQDFDSDYIDCGDMPGIEGIAHLTILFWNYLQESPGASYAALFGKVEGTDGKDRTYWHIYDSGNNRILAGMANGANGYIYKDNVYADAVWEYNTYLYDGTGVNNLAKLKIYINGVDQNFVITGAYSIGTTTDSNNNNFFWAWDGLAAKPDTIIDEGWIMGVTCNDSWIETAFNSQNQTTNFLTIGEENTYVAPSENYVILNRYPVDNATGICPCSDAICFDINTTTDNVNVTVYGRQLGGCCWHIWNKYTNITYDTYCFCMDAIHPSQRTHAVYRCNTTQTIAIIDTWYTVTWSSGHNIRMSMSDDMETITFLEHGHYTIKYWTAIKDNDIVTSGDLMAIALHCNDAIMDDSYREITFATKQHQKHLSGNLHDEFDRGDTLQLCYVGDDTDEVIETNGTWADSNLSAYIYIEKTGMEEHHPLMYNTTYEFYVNVTKYNDDTKSTNSSVYNFTTATEKCASSGSRGLIVSDNWVPIIGIIGLVGLFGFVFDMRRRNEKK